FLADVMNRSATPFTGVADLRRILLTVFQVQVGELVRGPILHGMSVLEELDEVTQLDHTALCQQGKPLGKWFACAGLQFLYERLILHKPGRKLEYELQSQLHDPRILCSQDFSEVLGVVVRRHGNTRAVTIRQVERFSASLNTQALAKTKD